MKVGNVKSDWMEINKGCPQGSLFGPLEFNIFSNDLLLLVQDRCDVYNYSDDNSIGIKGKDPNEITDKLSNVSSIMLRWFENNYLQVNPDKFQFIIFNKVPKNCILSLNELVQLNSIQEVKLLGVTFDSQLTFKSHIGNICMKAGTKINALSRFCSVLDKQFRYEMFYSFILSYFKFCSVVWHNCSVSDMKKIENIQKRALRIIVNDSNATYRELRERSQRPLLYIERLRSIVLTIFKIYHGFAPSHLNCFLTKKDKLYDTRNVNQLNLLDFNTVKHGHHSFNYYGSFLWNNLPNKLRAETDLIKFISLLYEWNGPCCNCGNCILCSLKQMY